MEDSEKYKDLMNHLENEHEDEVSDFLRKAADAKVPESKNKEAIWKEISESIDKDELAEKKAIPLWRYVGIAAAIAIIATFSILVFNGGDEPVELPLSIITNVGESYTESLPDGSNVFLNAASSIRYQKKEWNREIYLTGEAFFEVEKGEKFLVKTDLGNVQVLGTSFNVFARDGEFEVSCKTGKVKVTIPEKNVEEDIIPGQMISLRADTVRRMDRLPELMGKWKAGEFYFNNQPISEVFKEIQRQFDIEIEFEGPQSQAFSGYFTNKDLEVALDMVCLPLGLEYQKTGQDKFAVSKSVQ